MYCRVKSGEQTVFVYTDPEKTLEDVKKTYANIVDEPAAAVKLLDEKKAAVDESKTVSELKLETGFVLYAE